MSGTLPGQRQMLLYIEHDEENWQLARARLLDRYDVVRASSAEQACELLCRRGRDFTAILMDVELEDSAVNGLDLTALLRGRPTRNHGERTPGLPTRSTRNRPERSMPERSMGSTPR